ncbi:hypothetical protein BGX38DRAFT_376718 [Terfezia claveryi]|nr:hypothetical protein BGX38DRAFT_376718 [Terfezia claveryi]
MFASGINKNTKKFAPKITQRRKLGGPTPTPTPSSRPSDASTPAAGILPTESILSVQDETANPESRLSPRPPLTSRTSLTPALTPILLLEASHYPSVEAPTSAVATEGPSNENETPVPPTFPQSVGKQHQHSREHTQEIDAPGSPTPSAIRAPSPPTIPGLQSSPAPVPTIQETATLVLTVQASPVIPVKATEISVPTSVPTARATSTVILTVEATSTVIPTVQATPGPVPITPPSVIPTVLSTASTVIDTPQLIPEDLEEPRKRRRFSAPTRHQYTPQDDEDEAMEDVELDDDRDEDYEEEMKYHPSQRLGTQLPAASTQS